MCASGSSSACGKTFGGDASQTLFFIYNLYTFLHFTHSSVSKYAFNWFYFIFKVKGFNLIPNMTTTQWIYKWHLNKLCYDFQYFDDVISQNVQGYWSGTLFSDSANFSFRISNKIPYIVILSLIPIHLIPYTGNGLSLKNNSNKYL